MQKQALNPPGLATPPGYSQVVAVSGGTTVYVAGQVAWDADGQLVGGDDFAMQARQVFANLREALAAAGARPADMVKIGIFVVDHDDEKLGVIRAVRDEILGVDSPPTSTLLGVERLARPGLLIEADAVAVVD